MQTPSEKVANLFALQAKHHECNIWAASPKHALSPVAKLE
jgi:hypothetical protein